MAIPMTPITRALVQKLIAAATPLEQLNCPAKMLDILIGAGLIRVRYKDEDGPRRAELTEDGIEWATENGVTGE